MKQGFVIMVQSVERCDQILRIIAQSADGAKLNDIAQQTGLKYSTVYNLAASLLKCGMLEKEDNLFFPGPIFSEFNSVRRKRIYTEHICEEIVRLGKYSKPHTFVFSVPRGSQIHAVLWKKIEEREPKKVLQILPPLNTAAGIVMFTYLPPKEAAALMEAHLNDAVFREKWNGSREKLENSIALCRKNGYAVLPYEDAGTLRIAAPVFADGKFIGALTWTRHTTDYSELNIMLPHILNLNEPETEITTSETLFQA